jgi:hypothetical protein
MKLFPTIGMVYPLYGLIRPGGKLIEVLRKRNDVNIKELVFRGLSAIRGRTIATMIRRNLFEVSLYSLARIIQGLKQDNKNRLRYAGYKNQIEYTITMLGYIVGWMFPYKYLVSKR